MHRIEQYFMRHFSAAPPGLPAGFGNANRYLASGYTSAGVGIQSQGEYIGWAGQSKKLMVKFRHLPVADQGNRQLPQGGFKYQCASKPIAEGGDFRIGSGGGGNRQIEAKRLG